MITLQLPLCYCTQAAEEPAPSFESNTTLLLLNECNGFPDKYDCVCVPSQLFEILLLLLIPAPLPLLTLLLMLPDYEFSLALFEDNCTPEKEIVAFFMNTFGGSFKL